MPLSDPFDVRADTIRIFLELAPLKVLALRHPPDLAVMVRKLLSSLDDRPENPHVFVPLDVSFSDGPSFAREVVDALAEHVESARSELAEAHVHPPNPPSLHSRDPETADETLALLRRAAAYASEVAEALGDDVGALCLVLSPTHVASAHGFQQAVITLSEGLRSDWCKLLVLDDTASPTMEGIQAAYPGALELAFAVRPDEIEQAVASELAESRDGGPARLRLLMLAGAMASSRGEPERARELLAEALLGAQQQESSEDEAHSRFNLGNVELAAGAWDAAAEQFLAASSLATDSGLDSLSAMALTNLGVTLHRLGRGEEALDAFGAAWELFRALDFRPGQAHVLDCTAQAYRLGGDLPRARHLWDEASAIYGSIEAPHLSSIRESGQAHIRQRLAELAAAGTS